MAKLLVGWIDEFLGILGGEMLQTRYREWRLRKDPERLQKTWGKESDARIDEDEMLLIREWHSIQNSKDSFEIDEITWNDLEMDLIYKRVNATLTSAGDSVLYSMLKLLLIKHDQVKKRSAQIRALSENEEVRNKIRELLNKIGHDYRMDIQLIFKQGQASNKWVRCLLIARNVAFPVFIALGIVVSPAFLVVGVFLAVWNAMGSARDQSGIFNDMPTILWLTKLLRTAEGLPEWLEQCGEGQLSEQLKENLKETRSISNSLLIRLFLAPDDLTLIFKSLFSLDRISYHRMLKNLQEKREQVLKVFEIVGQIDALLAVGSYRVQIQNWCEPKVGKGEKLAIENMRHPLIENAVPNPVDLSRPILLTGSNASGKSTYLKTLMITALMAQTLCTCLAESYEGDVYALYSSMSLRDSTLKGQSYFMAEISSLKRIVDYDGPLPCLAAVDEVLRGTNTGERIAAASTVLRALAKRGVLCVAATHDGELAQLLEGSYVNAHFTEQFDGTDMFFDYKLRSGPAGSRNALNLLRAMGYDEELVKRAEHILENYEKTGEWI